jgi:hypothetical protein
MPVGAFLYEFKQMDLVIEIDSSVLGETIALVSNRKCLPAVTAWCGALLAGRDGLPA